MHTQTRMPESALEFTEALAERVEAYLGQENQVFENIKDPQSEGIDRLRLSKGGLIIATRSRLGVSSAVGTPEGEYDPDLLAIEHLYSPDSREPFLSRRSGSILLRHMLGDEAGQPVFVPVTETDRARTNTRTSVTTYYLPQARPLTAVGISEAETLLDRYEAARNTRLAAA